MTLDTHNAIMVAAEKALLDGVSLKAIVASIKALQPAAVTRTGNRRVAGTVPAPRGTVRP